MWFFVFDHMSPHQKGPLPFTMFAIAMERELY